MVSMGVASGGAHHMRIDVEDKFSKENQDCN